MVISKSLDFQYFPFEYAEEIIRMIRIDVRLGIFPDFDQDNKFIAIPKYSAKDLSALAAISTFAKSPSGKAKAEGGELILIAIITGALRGRPAGWAPCMGAAAPCWLDAERGSPAGWV